MFQELDFVELDGERVLVKSSWMKLGLTVTRYADASQIAERLQTDGFRVRVRKCEPRRISAGSSSSASRRTSTIS